MQKKVSLAFNKKIYLLGCNEYGTNYWLEAPSWDCGWYWGFGYVETYTNNTNPSIAKDIQSHEHIDSSFLKDSFNDIEQRSNIYDSPKLKTKTFTRDEGLELTTLFKEFYRLKDIAKGNTQINEVEIPRITARILEILSPKVKTPLAALYIPVEDEQL